MIVLSKKPFGLCNPDNLELKVILKRIEFKQFILLEEEMQPQRG